MNLEIRKTRLGELEKFVKSSEFGHFKTIPVSDLRVKSYVNNPHAHPEDVVLYLGFVENELVAFRTVFADMIKTENEHVRFAWCSGNWVHPGFRRKGFSELLLNEAFTDWDGKLMFTNYAPDSETLYIKSRKFQVIHQFQGIREYLFPKTRKLYSRAVHNRLSGMVFSFIDCAISAVSTVRVWFYRAKQDPDFKFTQVRFPDEECYKISDSFNDQFLFNRGKMELKWIFQYPWISGEKKYSPENYPFSSYSESFAYQTIKIFRQDLFIGFFIFSVREGHLKTLHFCLPEGIEQEIAGYLKKFCAMYKIEFITVYNTEIAQQLLNRKFPFLHVKNYGQKIYSTFNIQNVDSYRFRDGDGDVIFT